MKNFLKIIQNNVKYVTMLPHEYSTNTKTYITSPRCKLLRLYTVGDSLINEYGASMEAY